MSNAAEPTPTDAPSTSSPQPATAPQASTADVLELLGLVAQLEHVAFMRLASDCAIAPDAVQALALSRFAAAAVERRDRVLARVSELGADPAAVMGQFDDVLSEFDARTQPSTWWERLLKAYVGYGVADDFCRLAAQGLDDRSRTVVLEVLDDASHAELAVAELDAAGSGDGALSSRLALWGRRLVGEALGTVQRLLTQRPGLERLVRAGSVQEPDQSDAAQQAQVTGAATPNAPAKIFGELTAQHTRRMSRLGLTA
ncbi:ferritin-like fold-containing protein [Cellulomonas gelida]|uniref:Ferritin-like domain-containing protein n=1 Tax=Cellulomonas gelida TaxID=1712 RepID=A0A4Y3KJL8_9CELL|nr:ferritin-like fold-containing protein [Cellulomonas gelida]GEA84093.1 hypothetical protein CGE01nite_13440 [Cellulomonas gelida]GGL23378.1 hypothetical protein GCM10009774_12140 [Cellulomonas gelida]